MKKPLWEAMQLEKAVYFGVLLLLVLVASFSIISTLAMAVMEKGPDIAVLKSMGASDGSILRIFVFQGGLIGFLGLLIGTVLGYMGCIALRAYGFPLNEKVFGMDTVPVQFSAVNFTLVAASAFLITSLASVYPAHRASKLCPAEVLR